MSLVGEGGATWEHRTEGQKQEDMSIVSRDGETVSTGLKKWDDVSLKKWECEGDVSGEWWGHNDFSRSGQWEQGDLSRNGDQWENIASVRQHAEDVPRKSWERADVSGDVREVEDAYNIQWKQQNVSRNVHELTWEARSVSSLRQPLGDIPSESWAHGDISTDWWGKQGVSRGKREDFPRQSQEQGDVSTQEVVSMTKLEDISCEKVNRIRSQQLGNASREGWVREDTSCGGREKENVSSVKWRQDVSSDKREQVDASNEKAKQEDITGDEEKQKGVPSRRHKLEGFSRRRWGHKDISTIRQQLHDVSRGSWECEDISSSRRIGWVQIDVLTVPQQTQTVAVDTQEKETQTSHPVVMRADLCRTLSLLEPEETLMPLGQFDRQSPGRISTSPTLRRMRSSVRHLKVDMLNAYTPSPRASKTRSPLAEADKDCSNQPNALEPTHEDTDEANKAGQIRLQERRRSSVVVSLPGLDVSPGDLFVSNTAAGILDLSSNADTKKVKWPFSRRGTTKGRPSVTAHVEKCLSTMQVQDWRNSDFHRYKSCSLETFLKIHGRDVTALNGTTELRREEAVWELFTSECVYFLDQLMVLKEVFFSTLTSLQMLDCLSDVDPWKLFANLNELCLVSSSFLNSLLRCILQSWDVPVCGRSRYLPELLTKAFGESICPCQQKYCLNYSSAVVYADGLKQRDDFTLYMKWCEGHQECQRLHLKDLLVAPLQRLTRYPLLLTNVCKRSASQPEQTTLQAVVELVDTSIRDLEGKVRWLDNYHDIQLLKECLVWPPVWEQSKKVFVPENLKHLLKAVSPENLVTQRNLLYEGKLALTENSKVQEVYLFLFEEFLLITKTKRNKKRSGALASELSSLHPALRQELQDGCSFLVLDQPIPLDRMTLRNVDQLNAAATGLPHAFVIMHLNRYQQCIGVFILQAPSEAIKKSWMSEIENAIGAHQQQDYQRHKARLESSQI